MRRFILSLLITILAITVFSKQVNEKTAKIAARTFFTNVLVKKNISYTDFIVADKFTDIDTIYSNSSSERVYYYIFNLKENKGFIIVSGYDNIEPILGYSTERNYDNNNIPANLKYFLNDYKLQIKSAIDNKVKISGAINYKWNELIKGTYGLQKSNKKKQLPLIQTSWNQIPYYNDLCPYDSTCECRCPTGCTATTMAQIMKYWNYPTTGKGFESYSTDNYGVLNSNFGGTTYNWTNMPLEVISKNNAVAKLMYDCGVSVNMMYGPQESGAYVIASDSPMCAENAFKNYFGFDSTTIKGLMRNKYTDSIWIDTIKYELDNFRPVQYVGYDGQNGGHTWVCDGYDSNDFFHMNWGWGGAGDGNYKLNLLNPMGFNFENGQQALIGIQPLATKGADKLFMRISQTTICPNNTVYFDAWGKAISFEWNFGDGSANSIFSNTQHKYITAGTYPVWIKMKDIYSKDTVLYDTIYVVDNLPFKNINLNIYPNTVCPNSKVNFTAQGTASAFIWDFGDNSPVSNNSFAEHTYTLEGIFIVSLKVTNYCGKDTIITSKVIVKNNAPVSNISYNISQNPACPNSTVSFNAWGDAISYEWDFGDGSAVYKAPKARHLYTTLGKYVVSIKMTNICGSDTTLFDTVKIVNSLPIKNARYGISPNPVCPHSIVNFTAKGGTSYLWNFGDSTIALYKDKFYHIYDTIGKYPVSVKITNNCGNDTILYDTVRVVDNIHIKNAKIYIYPNSVCPNDDVMFYAMGDAVSYVWNFGDGSPVVNNYNANHIYSYTGTYIASVKMTNYCGIDTTLYKTIKTANVYSPSKPYAYISADVACPYDEIIFYAYGESDSYSYIWNFADGSPTVNSPYTVHSFTSEGTYNVSLKTVNTCGKAVSSKYTIQIMNGIPVYDKNIYINPRHACPDESISFQTWGNASNFEWNFGDDSPKSYLSNTTHSYTKKGTYYISLNLSTNCGMDTTLTDTVYVEDNITPNPMYYSDTISSNLSCPGDTIKFYASPAGAGTYIWDFGDGTTSSETTEGIDDSGYLSDIAKHSYAKTGSYIVSFKFTNKCGNSFDKLFPVLISNNIPVSGDFWWDGVTNINESIEFNAYGGKGYKWDFGDETPLVITSSSDTPVFHSYKSKGIYTISVTITNSCGNAVTYNKDITIGVEGIQDNTVQKDLFKIYPNPNNGTFSIEFETTNREILNLEISNLCGQIIYSKQFNKNSNNNEEIQLPEKAKGLYFVKMQTKDNTTVKKLIIQ